MNPAHRISSLVALATGCFVLAAASLATAGGWVSLYNGASNQRLQPNEPPKAMWFQLWRRPRQGNAGVLVNKSIVVYQDGSGAGPSPDDFVGVDILTGATLWSFTPTASQGGHNRVGCIAGDRVLLPASKNGSGAVASFAEQVDCIALATGVKFWTWSSGVSGTVEDLQVSPKPLFSAPGSPTFDVTFATMDHIDGDTSATNPYGGTNAVFRRLNPLALTGPAALICTSPSTPPSPETWISGPFAVWQPGFPALAPNVFGIEHTPNSPAKNWQSTVLRGRDVATLLNPAAPPTGSPALSVNTPFLVNSMCRCPLVLNSGRGYLVDSSDGVPTANTVELKCFTMSTGALKWSVTLPSTTRFLMPFVGKTNVVVPDPKDKKVYVFNKVTGASVGSGLLPWTTGAPMDAFGGVLLKDDYGYLPLDNGDVYLGHAATAIGVVHHEAGGFHTVTPIVPVDGFILVSTPNELACYFHGAVFYGPPFEGPVTTNRISLTGIGPPRIGTVPTFSATNCVPNAPVILMLSSARASIPNYLGSLDQLVVDPTAGFVQLAGLADATGRADFPFAIPNNPAMVGSVIDFQALVVNGAAVGGIELSNGLEMTVIN